MKYSTPKGTFDILPEAVKPDRKWRLIHRYAYLEEVLRKTSLDYGFQEIRTPIFERTELFTRSAGEASDLVSKEMYTFEDKAKRLMSLRPEGTAPVIRALVENQMSGNRKYFYIGPYFRYDRPQAGRFRQFHQYGVEAVGNASPEQDVEVIDLIMEIYRRLGIKELKLLINSIGDKACRESYVKALKEFLQPHFAELSEESQARFEQNPLRILDTKNEREQQLLKSAPSILDFLSEESKAHFEKVLGWLDRLGISYEVTPSLVRGLDYYTQTVFEVTSNVLGAQNSIGAGGRYDGLMHELGGKDLPGMGFATGIERILHTMDGQGLSFPKPPHSTCFLIPMTNQAQEKLFPLLFALRRAGIAAEMSPVSKKVGKAVGEASDRGAHFALIMGEEELQKNVVQVKDLQSRAAQEVAIDDVMKTIKEKL
ncbi:MAG: histidine--tRNA ligase [Candidatus Algichlamydia australiensis]|nr:histidine--tRNA ligase [Chlamydiales bacterium]